MPREGPVPKAGRGSGIPCEVVTEHFPPNTDVASPQSPVLLWVRCRFCSRSSRPRGSREPGGGGGQGLRSGTLPACDSGTSALRQRVEAVRCVRCWGGTGSQPSRAWLRALPAPRALCGPAQ